MKRLAFLMLAALMSAGCSGSENKEQAADVGNIQEAVARQLVKRVEPRQGEGRVVIYVALNGNDPDEDFLKRIQGTRGILVGASSRPPGMGTVIAVDEVKWIDNDTVEVEAGHTINDKEGVRSRYRLVRRGKEWGVTKVTTLGVSSVSS